MKVRQEIVGGAAIVRLSGQLMGGPEAETVRETIQTLLEQGHRNLLVDLGEVSWVNSTGLGLLISSHLLAANHAGVLRLVGMSKRIRDILTVTRLDTVFQVYDDEQTALASFQA